MEEGGRDKTITPVILHTDSGETAAILGRTRVIFGLLVMPPVTMPHSENPCWVSLMVKTSRWANREDAETKGPTAQHGRN